MNTPEFLGHLKPELDQLALNLRNGDQPAARDTLTRLDALTVRHQDAIPCTLFSFTDTHLASHGTRTAILILLNALLTLAIEPEPQPAPDPAT